MTQSDVKIQFTFALNASIIIVGRKEVLEEKVMNTFSIVVFLLASLGAVAAFVFMTLGVLIKSLRDTIPKSLIAFGIMFVLCAGSLWLCGKTPLKENVERPQSAIAVAMGNDTVNNTTNSYEDTYKPIQNISSDKVSSDFTNEDIPYTYNDEIYETISNSIVEVDTDNAEWEELQVHFIDVGQGDCTLITCDGEAMLIDAGDNNKGTAVQLYLQKRGINSLDYVIGTHPDADHIGGMDVIMTKFDCEQVMLPNVSNDTATYRDVIDTMEYRGYKNTLPVVGSSYSLGDATFTVIAPNGNYEDTNNYSIGIRLVHGENSFLFMGDAEEEAETDIMQNGLEISADVLKVAHHGSSSSSSKDFINTVSPTYAVISCGEDNSYGHPSAETLNTLRSGGIKVYRTDEQGSIIATSDGQSISFNCVSSESWKSGEIENVDNTVEQPSVNQEMVNNENTFENEETSVSEEPSIEHETSARYILNIGTKKFHDVHCSSVEDMTEENKVSSYKSRDEIIAEGYVPCKRCNP